MESIKVYDIDELDLKQHGFYLITSKRMSGKSVLIRSLLNYFLNKYDYDFIVLFSETA
jgi:hypothetical protein